jgi:hypothetical protein
MPPELRSLHLRRTILFGSLMLAALVAVIGIGTVWMRYQITTAASQAREHENRRIALERRSDELQGQVASLLNPEFLQRQNQAFALGLVPTNETQVIRVAGSASRMLAAKRNTGLLAGAEAAGVASSKQPGQLASFQPPILR